MGGPHRSGSAGGTLAHLARQLDQDQSLQRLHITAAGTEAEARHPATLRSEARGSCPHRLTLVGHLLGLGDRHLDNMLLHRRGAHLVHIDFSVVFDRGLQLKVPEVVPFRLTQTLLAALGVLGVEGAFRLGCERALGALRANSAPLCALLEAALVDAGVDWDAEAVSKAASKAYAQAVALQVFALRQARSAAALATAAGAARASLAAAGATLAAYVQQFLAASGTAAAAAESHALLQRCQATLSSAAAQQQALTDQMERGQAALDQMLVEAQPMAVQLQACLQECQAWQQRHSALLPLLLNNPPTSLLSGPASLDPAAAAAAGCAPLLLVGSPAADSGSGEGAGSILHAALGMLPTHSPLSAGLLLQAAAADEAGRQLLGERAEAAQQLAGALQQYAAAVACLLGGASYASTSQHAHWLPAFQAAMDLPVPQGFERATELAPRMPAQSEVAAAWRPLAAAAAAAVGLSDQLASTSAALQLERVDVALAAADSKQRLVDAAGAAWAAAAAAATLQGRQQAAAALAQAFAAFSEQQAGAALQLAAEHEQEQAQIQEATAAAGVEGEVPADAPAALLAGVQRLILGYASTAVAVRDATSEALFLAPDGSSLLGWLSEAVQAADSISTAAAELQLLLPPLLALLHSPEAAVQVSGAVAQAAEHLEAADEAAEAGAAADGPEQQQDQQQQQGLLAGSAAAEARAAAGAMAPLLEAAALQPAVAALLQGLQRVQAAAQQLLPAGEQPSLAQQQLLLAGALVEVWQDLEDEVSAAGTAAAATSSEGSYAEAGAAAAAAGGASVAAAASAPWQQCSEVLGAAVAAEVCQHLLPPLADALGSTARQLRASAGGLAQRAGLDVALGPSAAPGQSPGVPPGRGEPAELVPFSDFDVDLPGAGMLLGGLEDELELDLAPAGRPHAEVDARQAGSAEPAEPQLVPFLDFDEGLAGADDLLEELEPATHGFAPVGSSQDTLSQPGPGGSLSQRSEGDAGAEGSGGGSAGGAGPQAQAEARQLAAVLGEVAQAAGALAAVDAVQYVSTLAAQQCQQLRQQHCSELAALQWANEHLLPAEAAAAAARLLAGTELSAAGAAVGAALPPVHPAVAAWALRASRQQLLQALQAGVGTLQGLEAPLQQWQQQLEAAKQQLEAEVAAAAPYAGPALQHHLQLQQQWLQSAASQAASLLEISQAVLQFEASRTAGAGISSAETAGEAGAGAAPLQPAAVVVLDRFQAEQQEGWERYSALLAQMQQLQGRYAAAQRHVSAAAAELRQLALRRQEALSIQESAEAAGSSAASNFAALALPLVKATQQLPPAVTKLLPQLAGSAEWAAALRRAQRCAAELATCAAAAETSGEGAGAAAEVAVQAGQAADQLATAAACVQWLPEAVEALQAALLPARNRLLAGGRGEAAAQAQAADVVDALGVAVTRLHSQLDKVAEVQQWLGELPDSLQALASRAAQQARELQSRHGFTLQGLEELVPGAGQGQGQSQAGSRPMARAGPPSGGALTGSLLPVSLVPPGHSCKQQQQQQQRREFAAAVLRRFRAKLDGLGPTASSTPSSNSSSRSSDGRAGEDGVGGAPAISVAEQVQRLVAAATSTHNLARMYEGWMPWV